MIFRDGTRLQLFSVGGRTAVTWLRRGHTCVLSGAGVPGRVLLRLAAWRGDGTIPLLTASLLAEI